jgi:hypothetical protein
MLCIGILLLPLLLENQKMGWELAVSPVKWKSRQKKDLN